MENNNIQKKNHNVFYVGLLSFFGGISQDIFSPILPIYLTSVLGFDKAVVGIAEGIVTASVNFFRIVAGLLSDKFKKQKPIIFLGYFLSMIARPLLVLFTTVGGVLGLRLLDGIGKGIKDPAKDVLIAGSSAKETRGKSFGIARMLDTMGSVVGPLILFVLLYIFQNSNALYHKILLFSAIPLVITLLLIFKLKELPKAEFKKVEAIGTKGKFPPSFYVFISIVILFTLGNSSDAFLILRARNLGITLLEIPLVIALFNFIYALAAVPFGSLSDKIGRIPTLVIGWLAYALVYLGFALATHAISIWFLYAFYGIYYATSEGVSRALLTDIVNPDHRGRAFGIYGMVVGLTTLPASFFAGFLWDKFGAPVPFYFGATTAVLSCIALFIFSRTLKKGNI
ncbi:MAG: MFS transporter [Candidatus Staskawiczbacteria bacterium]|nr:MFS transporter [Candidatus Staskawiczbacteria bacterium]